MQGYRTYTSIVLVLLGSFGVLEKLGITQEEAAQFLDSVMVVVAGASALYFNYQNHKRMQ